MRLDAPGMRQDAGDATKIRVGDASEFAADRS